MRQLFTTLALFLCFCATAGVAKPPKASPSQPIVFDVTEFDEASISALVQALTDNDGKEIWLRIETNGGSVHGANVLMRRLETMKSKVVCIVDTKAFSAGFYLLQSSGCTKRLMTSRSTLMAHRPLFLETGGNADELRTQADSLQAMGDAMIAMMSERMCMKAKALDDLMKPELWMSYDKAVKLNAVDGSISPSKIPASTPVQKKASLFQMLGL